MSFSFSVGTGFSGEAPASKKSIDALPTIKVTDRGSECAICLSEFEVGGEAKQMPCKHKYHAGCIDKWLGIKRSCPTCRFKMPEKAAEVTRMPEFVFYSYFAWSWSSLSVAIPGPGWDEYESDVDMIDVDMMDVDIGSAQPEDMDVDQNYY